MKIQRYGSRYWAVYDDEGKLVCVTVYKRGAAEVVKRLAPNAVPTPRPHGDSSNSMPHIGTHVIEVLLPNWIDETPDTGLRSIAEEAYYAKALALYHGAAEAEDCGLHFCAGEEALREMENENFSPSRRQAAGEQALELFSEAKIRARTVH